MDDNEENGDSRVLPFSARLGGDKPPEGDVPDDDAELVAPGEIFATAGGQRSAVALEFIRRDGTSFVVPYAYLPLLWWQPPDTLVIEYQGVFSVLLQGRELGELKRRIKDHRITWIREFDEHQAEGLSCVVTRIEIVRVYPSREAGSRGSQLRELIAHAQSEQPKRL